MKLTKKSKYYQTKELSENDKRWVKHCKSKEGLKFESFLIDLYNK